MAGLGRIGDAEAIRVWDKVVGRTVEGERITLAVVELEPNSVVPEHRHPNEQVGIVLRGSCRFRVGEEERDLVAGGTWNIPANTPHEVHVGPDGAVMIDTFSPVRQDWHALPEADGHVPTWPGGAEQKG
jgi:unsaturated pyranuronate lyase